MPRIECKRCKGTRVVGKRREPCPKCKGQGYVEMPDKPKNGIPGQS